MTLDELSKLNGLVARLTHFRMKKTLADEDRAEVVAIAKQVDPQLWEDIWVKPVLGGSAA